MGKENRKKSEKKRGWELITDAFVKRGVEFLFTVPGESISPVQRACEGTTIRIISARHEQSAAFMAETYGRMTRKAGTVVVTFAPGFTNTLSAIQNANMSNSPLILIAGAHGRKAPDRLGLQDMKQEPVIQSIVKKSFVCGQAERIPDYIDMAFRYAENGRPGPVFLELPVDVLTAKVDAKDVSVRHTIVESRPVDPRDVKRMMAIIRDSKRPVIITGSGTYYSDAGPELTAFIERTGIPVFTSKFSRGIVPDTHPLCFGSSVVLTPGCAIWATLMSDCYILLGTRLCIYHATGDLYNPEGKIIQVDIEPEEIGRNRSSDHAIFADIKGLLDQCNQYVDDEGMGSELQKNFAPWVAELRKEHSERKELQKFNTERNHVPIHPGRLTKEIDNFMDRADDVVVTDGGDLPSWVLTTRTCRGAWNEMASGLFGCLGVGLPYANAAKLIRPQSRVLLCTGDGSIGFNFMELETSIRKNLPIVVVIGNNNLWGMTSNSMRHRFGHLVPGTVELNYVPYHKMMEALGGKGMLVEKPEDIGPALKEAFASGQTTVINVMIDPAVIGPASEAMANMKEGEEI
ncbi:MAG: thiamine pyrophosphate-binding protein [Deltaproteobacteria bacterium]|nr:thiamine pyrophosphate-binding protein [Deltaproteobacteria bacterium]